MPTLKSKKSHLLKKSLMENFIFCAVSVMNATNLSVSFLITSTNHFHNIAHQTTIISTARKFNMYFPDLTWDSDEENN